MQGKKETLEGHTDGSLQPFREYSVAALSAITDVSAAVLTKAIERRALAAVKGPGGRGGKWRVLGQSYIDWQKTRHGQPQRPVYRNEALADAEARLKAARRVPGYTNTQQPLGGVAQPRGGVTMQGEEETPPK